MAVSDPLGRTAQPLETIKRDERFAERLLKLIEERRAERLVVGLPLSMDGTESSQAGAVRRFVEEIEGILNIPVTFVDERLSSREANSLIREGGAGPVENAVRRTGLRRHLFFDCTSITYRRIDLGRASRLLPVKD